MKETPGSNTTEKIEKELELLIIAHGLSAVRENLKKILPRSRWSDWQRLANLAENVSRRIERAANPSCSLCTGNGHTTDHSLCDCIRIQEAA